MHFWPFHLLVKKVTIDTSMNKRNLEALLESILSQPTAPFHEYHVRAALLRELKGFKGIKTRIDNYGNLIAEYKRGRSKPRWVMGAHMDHPGWVRVGKRGKEFLGGVPESYRNQNIEQIEWMGAFGMWNLPPFERWNGTIKSRACDDLVGCAAIVSVLQELSRQDIAAHCYAVFTRAEEVGFLGAAHLAENWEFPDEVSFINIEASAPVGEQKCGDGPVLRVGDRLSLFDHETTAILEIIAQKKKIPFQRLLLDRGACEASATQAFGIRSAGISLLIENYHNCGPNGAILSEEVSFDDLVHMVQLLIALLSCPLRELPDPYDHLRQRMKELSKRYAMHESTSQAEWEKHPKK